MDDRTTPCATPLSWETLVAYWAGDLPEDQEESADLHLMGCAVCTAESKRVAAVTESLRAGAAAAGPALRVVQGEKQDARPPPPPRRRWFLGAVGAATLVAAAAIFLLIPRGAMVATLHLPAPVRDAAAVELVLPSGAREVRLEPELAPGVTANGARVRRLDGGWLAVRVEAGPPFAVVVSGSDLPPGRYELELVQASPDGREESRGFYRFAIRPPGGP